MTMWQVLYIQTWYLKEPTENLTGHRPYRPGHSHSTGSPALAPRCDVFKLGNAVQRRPDLFSEASKLREYLLLRLFNHREPHLCLQFSFREGFHLEPQCHSAEKDLKHSLKH